jgi:hypothetical protein
MLPKALPVTIIIRFDIIRATSVGGQLAARQQAIGGPPGTELSKVTEQHHAKTDAA